MLSDGIKNRGYVMLGHGCVHVETDFQGAIAGFHQRALDPGPAVFRRSEAQHLWIGNQIEPDVLPDDSAAQGDAGVVPTFKVPRLWTMAICSTIRFEFPQECMRTGPHASTMMFMAGMIASAQ